MPPPENGSGAGKYFPEVDSDWTLKHQKIKQSALKESETLRCHARECLQTIFRTGKHLFGARRAKTRRAAIPFGKA